MLPTLKIGPLSLPLPGLLLIGAVWAWLELAARRAARLGLAPDHVYNAGVLGLLAAAGGARAVFVAQHADAYAGAWFEALDPRTPGTFAVAPGIAIGLLAVLLYARVRRLPWRDLADAFAAATPWLIALWALADLAGGTGFGQPAPDLPWAIPLWDARRHPTQVYELLAALVIGALVWRAARPYPGHTTLLCAALYASARVGLEGLRADSWLLPGGWRGPQVLALVIAVGALALLARGEQPEGEGH